MEKTFKNRPNFLGSEVGLVRKTITVKADNAEAVTENGRKIVVAGTIFTTPYYGLLFEDVDVTDGDREGSLIIGGRYIDANLPKSASSYATQFQNQGLYAIVEGAVTRPDYGSVGLTALSSPSPSASTKTISWSAVSNAVGYTIYNANQEQIATTTSTSYVATATGTYYVQANGDNINYASSGLASVSVTTLE